MRFARSSPATDSSDRPFRLASKTASPPGEGEAVYGLLRMCSAGQRPQAQRLPATWIRVIDSSSFACASANPSSWEASEASSRSASSFSRSAASTSMCSVRTHLPQEQSRDWGGFPRSRTLRRDVYERSPTRYISSPTRRLARRECVREECPCSLLRPG